MGSFSNYAENELLDHILGTGAYTMPTVYVGLSTVAYVNDTTTLTELSGNGYAREAAAFGAASGGAASNSGAITFDTATGDWGTVQSFILYDALTNGNELARGALTANKTISNGDTARFAAGEIDVTLD